MGYGGVDHGSGAVEFVLFRLSQQPHVLYVPIRMWSSIVEPI